MKASDILIIGAGPGGYETAARALSMGKTVTLVEKGELGGTCLNRGCIPTKCYCRSAQAMLDAKESASLGVILPQGDVSVDYPNVVNRKDGVVAQLREGISFLLQKAEIIKGEASFKDAKTVVVNGEEYSAGNIIIATGSKPASLPIPGAELCINSDQILEMTTLPDSLAIIGGGVIGIEFASIYAALGVKVTVIEYCPEILPPFDKEIAKRLRTALKRRGIDVIVGAAVKEVKPGFKVLYDLKGKEKEVEASMVLMAVGRRPVLPNGLSDFAPISKRGFVDVDDKMRVQGFDNLYAIGDCNGKCMLAHAATAQGMVTLGEDIDLTVIPSAVFSVPECSMVGLTEEQCQQKELNYKVGKAMYRANGKALAMGEPDGMVKMIADKDSGRILGCHIIGAHAADLIEEVAVVMAKDNAVYYELIATPEDDYEVDLPYNRLTVKDLANTVHGHPTLSEVVMKAAEACL